VAGPVATRLGLARVATAQGFTGGGWKNRAYECLQRRALRRCDAVIAVSDELARALAEAGIGGVHTVPNGPPLAAEPLPPRSAREALGAGPDEYHIGWVGRLSPEKGPDVLLRALEALRDEPSWSASFVGDGAMRDDLERAAEGSGLGDRVRFAGRVEDAARLFSGFDLFVLSSRSEGTPVALLEAVAARTPIVASRVGGVERAVGPAGAVLIPPGDPRALADAILSARADPSAATRRAEAALHARDARPDWIAAYEAIYREVLSGAAAAPEADR
jgi:glycosyltransferase involved in cell wall biosynthesis